MGNDIAFPPPFSPLFQVSETPQLSCNVPDDSFTPDSMMTIPFEVQKSDGSSVLLKSESWGKSELESPNTQLTLRNRRTLSSPLNLTRALSLFLEPFQ